KREKVDQTSPDELTLFYKLKLRPSFRRFVIIFPLTDKYIMVCDRFVQMLQPFCRLPLHHKAKACVQCFTVSFIYVDHLRQKPFTRTFSVHSVSWSVVLQFLFIDRSTGHLTSPSYPLEESVESCSGLHMFTDYRDRCAYVTSAAQCQPEGYINYLQLLYCTCGKYPVLGHIILTLWLVLLFYLLGNTAANYFCSSLEGLSRFLRLSPAIAGVTLLSLGNGAPDVFASLVSFMGTSTGDVGFNSILGGAFFVSSVVTGIISICVGSKNVSVDKPSFIRDACFFLVALSALVLIISIGRINIWGAIAFTCLYLIYVLFTSAAHCCCKDRKAGISAGKDPLVLPVNSCDHAPLSHEYSEKNSALGTPLLGEAALSEQEEAVAPGQRLSKGATSVRLRRPSSVTDYLEKAVCLLNLPLYLIRRLTIPDVSEERWSKAFAVASASLAPMLLAALWGTQKRGGDMSSQLQGSSLEVYVVGGVTGLVLGLTAFLTTDGTNPPEKLMSFPWLAGGFLMSVVWTYITAEELVSLMLSLGVVLGIRPSLLGLTLLAWGNSIGDLIANVLMAVNRGPDGAQVAVSGCYAGPIFNILVGLGASLIFCAWSVYPESYAIPDDPSLYQTIGFLTGGLLWATAILPGRGMRLGHVLGVGLVVIYLPALSSNGHCENLGRFRTYSNGTYERGIEIRLRNVRGTGIRMGMKVKKLVILMIGNARNFEIQPLFVEEKEPSNLIKHSFKIIVVLKMSFLLKPFSQTECREWSEEWGLVGWVEEEKELRMEQVDLEVVVGSQEVECERNQ
ncbi:hypothetical protein Taro_043868, partial [Colocasia esculenta]|nr:hypothetical protein [Colocasia esculenta]